MVGVKGFEPPTFSASPPLAVPEIVCSLSTSHNFDRCANKRSLHRPQDAVACVAQSKQAPVCVQDSGELKSIHYKEKQAKAWRLRLVFGRSEGI